MVSPRLVSSALATALLCVAGHVLVVSAQSKPQPTVKRETAPPFKGTDGKALYSQYCASCHGVGGKGDGPAAPAMKVPPTDLTTYAKRHGGEFSQSDLTEIIENERSLAAHGSKDMPIWGEVFRALESDVEMRRLRMHNLLGYLKSIQVK